MKHEKISDLLEKRSALFAQMTEAHEKDDADEFGNLEKELRSLDAKITRAKALDAADRIEPGTPIHGDTKLSGEIRDKFSLARAIAHAAGLKVDAGFEVEVQGELAKRAGKPAQGVFIPTEIFEKRVTTTSGAAEIVPTDFRPELFINALSANTVIRSLGATVLNGLRGNVSIPRETDSPQIGWVAENSALGSDDPDFDSVTLSPKHCGVISEYSRNMILQSSPDVEGLLRKMMARNVALAIDGAAIRGGGSNQPVGILGGISGIQTVAVTDLFKATMEEHHVGVRKAGSVLVGGDGLKWSAMQISPQDAELLESRKFGVIEVCRLFQVPPPLVQDYTNSTFTNSLQAGLWFGQYSLSPWARKLEAEFARSVFAAGSDIELEFDLNGFLRGDPATRWTNNKIAIDSGVLTADEVRQQEGWNPLTSAQRKTIEDWRKSAPAVRVG